MDDDLNDVFSPQEDSRPEPESSPAPPAAPALTVEGLAQEVGRLAQAFNTVIPALLQRGPAGGAGPSSPTPAQPDTSLSYQDQDYLDEAAAQRLLQSPDVRVELNGMLNRASKSVFERLAPEMQRLRGAVGGMYQQQQEAAARSQMQAQMQNDFSLFYGEHTDLEPHADLVMLEAQRLAREYQTNPYAFSGVTRAGVMQTLATRTRARLDSIRGGGAAPERSGPPARRTAVERGSGSRIGMAPPLKGEAKELNDMDAFIRG